MPGIPADGVIPRIGLVHKDMDLILVRVLMDGNHHGKVFKELRAK